MMRTGEWPEVSTVRDMIAGGLLDEHLWVLINDIKERQRVNRDFIEWVEGDRVKFNDFCGTKYLRGEMATIRQVRRTKVIVHLDRDCRRFRAGSDITVSTQMLDKVF